MGVSQRQTVLMCLRPSHPWRDTPVWAMFKPQLHKNKIFCLCMYVVSTLSDVNQQFVIHFTYGPLTGAMMILNLVIQE